MKKVFAKRMLCLVLFVVSLVSSVLCSSSWAQSGTGVGSDSQEAQGIRLQWKRPSDPDSAYVDVPDGLVEPSGSLKVLTKTTVMFRAINHAGTPWPAGQPHWSGLGVTGASGTGETKTVTFNDLSSSLSDYKIVTVEGEVAGDKAESKVVVYQLTLSTKAKEQFDGRSEDRYGVGENVKLLYSTTPDGINVNLDWFNLSGSGSIFKNVWKAGDVIYPFFTYDVTLVAAIVDGPSKGADRNLTRTLCAPLLALNVKRPFSYLIHSQGFPSVGFAGDIYFMPTDVSFANILFRERDCPPSSLSGPYEDLGYYKDHHASPDPRPVGLGRKSTGSKMDGFDLAFNVAYKVGEGHLDWDIPWDYRVVGEQYQLYWRLFQTTLQHHHEDENGTADITKIAGPFSKALGDPTKQDPINAVDPTPTPMSTP